MSIKSGVGKREAFSSDLITTSLSYLHWRSLRVPQHGFPGQVQVSFSQREHQPCYHPCAEAPQGRQRCLPYAVSGVTKAKAAAPVEALFAVAAIQPARCKSTSVTDSEDQVLAVQLIRSPELCQGAQLVVLPARHQPLQQAATSTASLLLLARSQE